MKNEPILIDIINDKYDHLSLLNEIDPILLQPIIKICNDYHMSFLDFDSCIMSSLKNRLSKEVFDYLQGIHNNADVFSTLEEIHQILQSINKDYYIYELIDPSDNKVFYVGKGIGDRILYYGNSVFITNHYNKKLVNRISKIKQENNSIFYQIRFHSIVNSDEAYECEKNLIYYYGLKNLCNSRLGRDSFKKEKKIITQIKGILKNYNSWYSKVSSYKPLSIIEKLVFIYMLTKSVELNSVNGISVSIREMSTAIGAGKDVVYKTIKKLIEKDFIKLVYSGRKRYASKYNINTKIIEKLKELPELSKCTYFEHIELIQMVLEHDAFRYKTLNKSGCLIILHYIMNDKVSYTKKELIDLTGVSRETIKRALDKLIANKIICGHKNYVLNPVIAENKIEFINTLNKAAIRYNTLGKNDSYSALYKLEQYIYRRKMIRLQQGKNLSFSLEENLIIDLIENYLAGSLNNSLI